MWNQAAQCHSVSLLCLCRWVAESQRWANPADREAASPRWLMAQLLDNLLGWDRAGISVSLHLCRNYHLGPAVVYVHLCRSACLTPGRLWPAFWSCQLHYVFKALVFIFKLIILQAESTNSHLRIYCPTAVWLGVGLRSKLGTGDLVQVCREGSHPVTWDAMRCFISRKLSAWGGCQTQSLASGMQVFQLWDHRCPYFSFLVVLRGLQKFIKNVCMLWKNSEFQVFFFFTPKISLFYPVFHELSEVPLCIHERME